MRGNLTQQLIEKIAVKFLLCLPKEQLVDQRIGFHFQKAYFYYLDTQGFPNLIDRKLKTQQITAFFEKMLKVLPFNQFTRITPLSLDQLIEDSYYRVPVHGIIILNNEETKTVLVGSSDKLGFPKGKIREDELPHQCAYREVLEEIGFKAKIEPNNYVQVEVNAKKSIVKNCRFYICKIDESAIVAREANKLNGQRQIMHSFSEIKSIGWYSLSSQLPSLIEKGLVNSPSRLAFQELNKRNNKKLMYKEKKIINPLEQFEGFDNSKLAPIFLK